MKNILIRKGKKTVFNIVVHCRDCGRKQFILKEDFIFNNINDFFTKA